MSNKQLKVGLQIQAGVSGIAAIDKMADKIKQAGVDVGNLSKEGRELAQTFNRIEQEQGLVNNFKHLSKELEEVNQQLSETAKKSEQVSKGSGGNYTNQTKRLERLKEKQKSLNNQLAETASAMEKAGIASDKLAEHERKLAQQADKATKRLDKLTNEAKELKALGDAKIKLGIVDQDKIKKELEDTAKAYNLLKKSGKLSSKELAQANQLHTKKVMELEDQLRKTKPTIADVRGELAKFAGAGAAFTLIAREAMQFETAMTGVKKVVDGTPEQMDELAGTIKQLAYELGMTSEETAGIAAMGGQLGVAFNDLPKFTKLAGEMAVAFGMTSEEAGNAAAKMANVWGLPLDQVRELGDAINTLGNNTAAKESEITAAMLRIGGNAKQFGLAAEQAAALADAMIALGKPPEVAATAINALLLKLQTAEAQGEKFQSALGKVGYSAEQMAENIQANPQKAITDFISKLGDMDRQARAVALAELFGAEYADDISLLVEGSDSLAKALELVADKTKTAGALNDEFGAAMDTSEKKMAQAKEAVSSLSSTLGDSLLPVIGETAEAVGGMANAVNKFAESHPLVTQLAMSIAALKIGMLGANSAAKLLGVTMPLVNTSLAGTAASAAAATTGLTTATAATRGYAIATNFLSKALNVLKAHPIIFGLTAIATVLDLLTPKTEAWEKSVAKATDTLIELQNKAAEGIEINLDGEALKPVKDAIAEIDAEIQALSDAGTGVVDFAADLLPIWDSNVEKIAKLSEEKNKLLDAERELAQMQKANAEAEAARVEKAKAYAEQQNQIAEKNLALMQQRKAELEKLGETESDYYQYVTGAIHDLNKTLDETPTKTREAFEAVGLSLDELATGITDSEQKIIDGFGTAIDYINKTTTSSKEAGEAVDRYLFAAIEKIKSPEGLKAFIQQLESLREETQKAFDTENIDAAQYAAKMKQIDSAIDATKAKINSLNDTFTKLGDAISKATSIEQLVAFQREAKVAFDQGKISAEQYAEKIKEAQTRMVELYNSTGGISEANKSYAEATEAVKKQSQATKQATKEVKENTEATKSNAAAAEEQNVVYDKLYETTGKTAEQMSHLNDLSEKYVKAMNTFMDVGFSNSGMREDKVLHD